MLTILTPSKTMNFTTAAPQYVRQTMPYFASKAERLRTLLAGFNTVRISKLMNVSDQLAEKTRAMYRATVSKQAFWAYDGDVFKGVQAQTIDEAGAIFAQGHIVVPSAVYGLVRPYDMISPYRLEMKAKLAVHKNKDLYAFWGSELAHFVDSRADSEVLMLSSYEYARSILPFLSPSTQVVTPAFIDKKPNGKEEQVAVYNKMMRGVMARWVIDGRVNSLKRISDFSAHGYHYSAERSTPEKPVFYRSVMKPLVFAKS